MTVSPRTRTLAGLVRAGVLFVLVSVMASPAAAEPWYRPYERAQRELVDGRPAEAEAALLAAIAERPQAGCRLRTYGVRVRDYTPWYYLGIVLADQSRTVEAREALDRSLAEGVVQTCPGTQLQALDLLDRLERLESPDRQKPVDAAESMRPGSVASLREAALAVGAERFASGETAEARRAEAECGDCPTAHAAWFDALSRARVDGPILLMLEASAREALLAAELKLGREAAPPNEATLELERARSLLATSSSPADWLAAEASAERARELSAPRPAPASPAPTGGSRLVVSLQEAIARAELQAEGQEPDPVDQALRQAEADLALARRLALSGKASDLERGLALAERARAGFARRTGEATVEESERRRRSAILELCWSEGARVGKRALLPERED